MPFTIQQFASNIITTSQATISLTFATPILAGETVGIFATYIGTLGAGTCADALNNNFLPGNSISGSGWTKTAFYFINHPGGTSTVTFTAPGVVANKGIVGWRITSAGKIEYVASDCSVIASPGLAADALATADFSLNDDALIVGSSLNISSPGTLSVGTGFTASGSIWNNYGLAENRAITTAGNYSATFTTTDGTQTHLIGGLAFQNVAISDDFNRADGEIGPYYDVKFNQKWVVEANQIRPPVNPNQWNTVFKTGTFPDDQYASVEYISGGNSNLIYAGPCVRVSAAGYYDVLYRNGILEVWKVIGTTFGMLKSVAYTLRSGDMFGLMAIGQNLTVYVNGTRIPALDVTNAELTSGAPGLYGWYDSTVVRPVFGKLAHTAPIISTPRVVQSKHSGFDSTPVASKSLTFDAPVAPGSSVYAFGVCKGVNKLPDTVSDGTRTYLANDVVYVDADQYQNSWKYDNHPGGATTITMTFNTAAQYHALMIVEVADCDTTNSLHAVNTMSGDTYGAAVDAIKNASVTPAVDDCLILSWASNAEGLAGSVDAGTYWTSLGKSLNNSGAIGEFKTQHTAALVQPTYTQTGIDYRWIITALALKPVANTVAPITPTPAASIAASLVGAVILGSLTISLPPASSVAQGLAPATILGSVAVAPSASVCISDAVDPGVQKSSLALSTQSVSGFATTVVPAVVKSSILLTPAFAYAGSLVIDPAVILGSFTQSPGAVFSRASALDPGVVLSGKLNAANADINVLTVKYGINVLTVKYDVTDLTEKLSVQFLGAQ